ncbi:hypothetical protein [uncultured Mucilaginibacter sp.]|uniref:hypothetical protein n=1 Tax=uncultured Mucilaginibacter sp. TaxID=797541 RepID=UPI0025D9D913|nr:hypothetical protein [uncultured Mucilaginibacter sp.]
MKIFTITGLLFFCFTNTKYRQDTSAVSGRNKKSSDTIFLMRERGKDFYHIIYVEKNRKSAFYTKLLDFKMDKNDTNAYIQNCRDFDKNLHKPVRKFRFGGLARQWLPVYKYKNKYYLYYPGDTGLENRKLITDSTICYMNMEGYFPQQILSVKNPDSKTWTFGMFENAISLTLNIHIIDNKTKLAVWEDNRASGPYGYGLYVPREYAAKFDMIVNYTNGDLPDEFKFDKIDFKALLKNH